MSAAQAGTETAMIRVFNHIVALSLLCYRAMVAVTYQSHSYCTQALGFIGFQGQVGRHMALQHFQ